MSLKINRNFYIKEIKKIYILENPKKLLNRYFFSDSKYIKIKLNKELRLGILNFFLKIIFRPLDIFKIYKKLPREDSLKQKITNFYSLILLSKGIKNYSNSIVIIGDCQNALNMSVLQLSYFDENIEFWIINQGSGSIEKKIDFKYPKAVRKVFFPYSNESVYEKNLLLKAKQKKNGLEFYNIDTTLNLNLSSKLNKLAIFQGYNKNYRLYPIYIFFLVKEILLINYLRELTNFDKVDIFLHPRLRFFCCLNYLNFKRSIYFKIFDPKNEYKYRYVISYSPTIDSSLKEIVRYSRNYFYEIGSNFNKINIQKCIKKFDWT
tara:strand:+ start:852 stop:1811 length:960 start_codon:yes stop_codon:yes gene_type:complete